jgi:Putative porin
MTQYTYPRTLAGRPPLVRKALSLAVVAAIALTSLTCAAESTNLAAPANAVAAPESAMVQLIRGLMQSGALAKDVGEALLVQAQTETIAAQQAQRQAPVVAPSTGLRPEAGDVRVPYISQTVREQIRDEVKDEVMAQAKSEGWAAPNETPEWTKRIRLEGDVRLRNESRFFSGGNSNQLVNFAAINAGSPYDTNPNTNAALPQISNTRQDRENLLRIQARIGVLADISDVTHAGIRLASGNDDNPVSTTQTLGGGLNKKNVWLDQVWLSYKLLDWFTVTGGRFTNPFVSTDMLFSRDLNMDGLALQYLKPMTSNKNVDVFGTLGIIPLEYLSDSTPSRSVDKASSENKWLLGIQAGANWEIDETNRLRGALAYYDFKNVEGQVSTPCALYAGADGCSTDWSRPAFMQKGNTLMTLRDITLNPASPANTAQPQYFGLASEFQLLDLNLRWDTKVAGGYGLRLDANYIRNLAFDPDEMIRRSRGGIVNNLSASAAANQTAGDIQSGGNAYMLQATFGKPSPANRGDWNILAGYKFIESDAMPDGYNDSTFHLGGTNAQGYYLGGSYAIDKNAWFTGRWMATKEVFGPPLQIDILQLEFNARF